MFLGAAPVLLASSATSGAVTPLLLPLVAGNFVYIAGSDLMPEMKQIEDRWLSHVLVFSLGVTLMYSIPFIRSIVLAAL